MRITNSASLSLSLADTTTGTSKLDVEIHTENTSVGIVLDTEINVFLNTETKITRVREVVLDEFVFLDLQATFKNLESLFTTNGGMDGDLFITTNGEGTDGETS